MSLEGKRPDMQVHQNGPINAEPPGSALSVDDVTPVEAFYVRNHGPVPVIDASAWRLSVRGLVEHELELSLEELKDRFVEHELLATLQCAGNRREGLIAVRDIPGEAPWGPGATGNARWRGARLVDVLTAAGLKRTVEHIAFEGAEISEDAEPPEHYGASIPVQKAIADEVMLAWEMNGEPLRPIHGAPVRVLVPGYIGARSVKWLEKITAQSEMSDNFFQHTYRLLPPDADPKLAPPEDGVILGAVALNSAILTPADGDIVAAGERQLTGYAFAGDDRRIVRVDISTDNGEHWRQAQLQDDLGPWTWRRWQTQLSLKPGRVEIVARAWDSSAASQPENPAHVWNPKGYVNNSWARIELTVVP